MTAAPAIPKFVKPTRVREISNISFDNSGNNYHHNRGTIDASDHDDRNLDDSGKVSITFGPQSLLPPLPLPTLEETMAKFLKHLEALEADGDPEERRKTENVVREFLVDTRSIVDKGNTANDIQEGSVVGDTAITGPVLQDLLKDYDLNGRRNGSIGSYVEEFWSDAYLAPDSSVVLNLNPYFLLEESPDPKLAGNQIRRAASLAFASVKMASQLWHETLKPDTFRGKALCMAQFKALFGASRVPKSGVRDKIATYDRSTHVAVMCRNQLFYFQALWPDTGDVAVAEEDLVNILEAIHSHASKLHDAGNSDAASEQNYQSSVSALGVLTSLARGQWARARDEMIDSSTKNAESFKVVDSALFVLVLDDYIPRTKHEAAANMLHGSYRLSEYTPSAGGGSKEYQSGSCTNRWYDKLQIIVTADGGAGINFEHSAIDGHTALRYVSDIYADTIISFAQSITKMVHAHQGLIPSVISARVKRAIQTLDHQGRPTLDVSPKKIAFEISESIKRKIYFAETALGDQILASDTHILEFEDYGKSFITFNKLSPDSYVQMSMMLAYYRLYGKIVCAYEPVLTKGFFHGRTEAMRPATMEAKRLCEVFCDPSSSTREKLGALRNATIAHSKLVKECAAGKGVDRHLFALKCIAEKNGLPLPEFFRSECWRKLNHTILSTSNCGNPSLALFGFGPVVPDGYGIGYIIKDTRLHYAICSKHRQTRRYAATLEGVLREMASLLEPISNTKVRDSSVAITRTSARNGTSNTAMMVSADSYGDLWGENSFQSTVDEGRPQVIHEGTAEKRWSGESVAVDTVKSSEANFLSPPVQAPLNDEMTGPATAAITAIDGELRKKESRRRQVRRGSNDHMPIRPDRRVSVNTVQVKKGELAELMKLADEPEDEEEEPPQRLDDFLESNSVDEVDLHESTNVNFHLSTNVQFNNSDSNSTDDDANFLSSPMKAPLNDELDTGSPMASIPEDRRRSLGRRPPRRGSNDKLPIRPNRRSSATMLKPSEGDLAELRKLVDDPDNDLPQPIGENQ